MQSAFSSNLSHLGTSGVRVEKMVDRLSGGNFELKFFEPGALVPALECFDAASQGSVEACWPTAGYHTGKYPALAFFTAVPFGPGFGEFHAWMIYGGGKDLQNEIYARHNLYSIDCNTIGPDTSGWFREQVGSLEDLKGLKMRFFGLGAQVMQKLGVSTQLLAAADIYPALERGVIDATEFSMPNMDIDLGFYQVAKYNYYPGWHQQVSINELLMNKAACHHGVRCDRQKAGVDSDLVGRALGEAFESTLLQELEWHVHTALFALVLGYGYIWNTHVRVDLVRENLAFRRKAWLELVGLTVFMIPFCLIVIWFAAIYAYDSWTIHEISRSQVGLSHRWIIKSILVVGLIIAALSGIAVWLQVVVVLWGPQNIRFPLMTLEWPEEAGSTIEGKERIKLEELEEAEWDTETDSLRRPAPSGN